MRSNARQVNLQPVEESSFPRAANRHEDDIPPGAIRAYIRRERSSAYWFAATKWGMAGLVAGIFFGAFMMYVATVSTLPIASDAVARGQTLKAVFATSGGN